MKRSICAVPQVVIAGASAIGFLAAVFCAK
jgi:hypothetical protein